MTALDTGVIHQHINGADVLFDMFNGGINFMFMSNIKRCGNGLNTLLVEFSTASSARSAVISLIIICAPYLPGRLPVKANALC